MTANDNHAYLNRLFDIAFTIGIIGLTTSHHKTIETKTNNRHTWSVLLPKIGFLKYRNLETFLYINPFLKRTINHKDIIIDSVLLISFIPIR